MEAYRHELKYFISYLEYRSILSRFQHILTRDIHVNEGGDYSIRSLYFDDCYNSAYFEKYASILKRKKYRIRLYDFNDDVIHLERKSKYDTYIKKESTAITKAQALDCSRNDFNSFFHSDHYLCKNFYHESVANLLRPRVIIDYEREPFICEAGNVRVTFDKNLRVCVDEFDLFSEDLAFQNVMGNHEIIMEVKFTEFLPEYIRDLLLSTNAAFTSFSKYILCCDHTKYKQHFG